MRFVALIVLFLTYFSNHLFAVSYPIHAFRSYHESKIQHMSLIGSINSKSKLMSSQPRLLDYDNRETVISGRLFEPSLLRVGDVVYIIEKDPNHKLHKNGYIVGQGTVLSIFETAFQGWMFKAKGNFTMVKEGHFIAIPQQTSDRGEALALFYKGNRERELGNLDKAFAFYKASLKTDPERAETYLEISLLAKRLGLATEAFVYINESWQRMGKFSDVSEVLRLPSHYLKMNLEQLQKEQRENLRLERLLNLVNDLKNYYNQIYWYTNSSTVMSDTNLFDESVHYYTAMLYEQIYTILHKNSLDKVMLWLEKKQRGILLQDIILSKEKILQPSKMWEEAFFIAAFYHYQLAHKINPMDGKASFRLTVLSFQKLQMFPSQKDKENYTNLLKLYGNSFLKYPNPPAQMARVRSMLENFPQ